MKTLMLSLMAGMISFYGPNFSSVSTPHPVIFDEPFEFVTDDGCGDFHVSGTLTIKFGDEGAELLKYEGTAVSLETGESTALQVRVVDSYGPRGFTSILHGVFPGVMQFHALFHLNIQGKYPNADLNVVTNDFSHCLN